MSARGIRVSSLVDAAEAHRVRCKLTTSQRHAVYRRDDYRCQACGIECVDNVWSGAGWTVDHITPIVRGGTNDESNLRTLCRRCNSRKGDR